MADPKKEHTMRAVVFDNTLKYITDHVKPSLKDDWAIVKILKAGICNTDLEIIKGYLGFNGILGHEFIGIVEECNNSTWIGKRVSGEINFACGHCGWCKKDLGRHCPNRSVLGILNADGCMADYCKIPVDCLIEIPASIPDNKAIFIEPLSAACEILEQLGNNISGNEKIVVLGDGKLGILCSWVLATVFKDVTLVGHHKNKLELAAWKHLKTTDNLDNISSADIIIEATGTSGGFETAMKICKPRGKIILKSTVAEYEPINLSNLVINEITVIGSRCGQFKDGLSILQHHKDIPLERLITATYPAEKSLEAFKKSAEKGILKVVINFS